MPRQSASGDPPVAGRPTGQPPGLACTPAEWRLVTRLPGQAIVAAMAEATNPAQPDGRRRTVTEGLAGLEGIAAGRFFDSELVRAVVAGIYAEADDGALAPGLTRPAAGRAELFASCGEVVRLLREWADPADSAAYRQWVQSIAARVCRAARPGGLTRDGGPVSRAERKFLDDLGSALGLV